MNWRRLLPILAAVSVAGCLGEDDFGLDVGTPDDPGYDELRSRLAIEIAPGDAPSGRTYSGDAECSERLDLMSTGGCCNQDYCSARRLSELLYWGCMTERRRDSPFMRTTCGNALREIDANVCAAERLLEIIEDPGERAIPASSDDEVMRALTIGPQDAESNHELARQAMSRLGEAFRQARERLAFVPAGNPSAVVCARADLWKAAFFHDDSTPDDAFVPGTARSYGEVLASYYVDAVALSRTAGDHLLQAGAAVSDAQLSRATDRAAAARLRLAPFASRVASAHALIGGEPGLPALGELGESGLFTRPPLSRRGQSALSLLRSLAPHPDAILREAEIPIAELVAGGATLPELSGATPTYSTLRARAARVIGESALGLATPAQFYQRFGIDESALIEARAWLAAEIRAFDRPVGATAARKARKLPPEPLADGTTSDFPIYSATRVPPTQPLDAYWSAVVRYDSTPVPVESLPAPWPVGALSNGWLPPGATWGVEGWKAGFAVLNDESGRTAASIIEDGALGLSNLLARLAPLSTDSAELQLRLTRTRNILGDALPPGLNDAAKSLSLDGATLLGRARICGVNRSAATPPRSFKLELDLGFSRAPATTPLRVVLGREGLDCAVRGQIDGTTCTRADLTGLTAQDIDGQPATLRSTEASKFETTLAPAPGTGPTASLSAFYVVRAETADAGPGQWEPLIGFVVDPPDAEEISCIGAAISPDLDRQVAETVSISDSDPGRSRIDCAGLPWDMPLPLEDELTDDHDGIESSWRHYLDAARAAATEADALGEDLVRVGIEMDVRAELQADELERLCGVRINVTEIGGLAPARIVQANMGRCERGYVLDEASGTCQLDLIDWAVQVGAIARPDLDAIRACIGDDSTVDWVALGDQPVCLWQYGNDSSTICANASEPDHPCPHAVFGARTAADCQFLLPGPITPPGATGPVNATPILATDTLNLFTIPAPPNNTGSSSGSAASLPCEAIARFRSLGERQDAYDDRDVGAVVDDLVAITRSSLFDQPQYRAWVSQLGWAPSAGGFSRVTFAGSTIATTGWYGARSEELLMWPAGENIGGINVFDSGLCPRDRDDRFTDALDSTEGLFCLTNVPQGPANVSRARANDLLARAVIAARVIGGVSLAENDRILLPYYPRGVYRARIRSTEGNAPAEEPVRTDFWETRLGRIEVDDTRDDSTAWRSADFDQIGAYAERVSAAGWDEWMYCPYEGTTDCVRFDSGQTKHDDTTLYAPGWYPGPDHTYELPLVVRRVGREVAVDGAAREAAPFFHSGGGNGWLVGALIDEASGTYSDGADRQRMTSVAGVPFASLTDYFIRDLEWRNEPYGHSCTDHHLACVEQNDSVDVRATHEGNVAHPEAPGGGLTVNDVLNGLELTCVAARLSTETPNFDGCGSAPEVRSLRDLLAAEAFLRCQADGIEADAGASVMANVPRRVIESVRRRGPRASSGASGEIASQVDTLAGAYEQMKSARDEMAGALRAVAGEIRQLRSTISESQHAHEIENLSLTSTVFDQVTTCAVAALNTAWDKPLSVAAGLTSCANSAVQIGLASRISQLRHEVLTAELEGAFARFDTGVATHLTEMSRIASGIRTQIASIDGALARLTGIRSEARRALARALYLESSDTGAHFAASAAYRARYNTALTRYRAAHDRAVRAAYIARRAVEQRLAMSLETMTDSLPTVAAPATWADEVCTLPTIDYQQVRGTPVALPDGGMAERLGAEGYSAAFVGDYVARLEQVVESYSFAFPFQAGTDTAVISLRDDIFRSLASCEVEAPNLLYQSNYLTSFAPGGVRGWERLIWPVGRTVPERDSSDRGVTVRQLTEADDAHDGMSVRDPGLVGGGTDLGRISAFRVRSAGGERPTALGQRLALREGRYRLSWYGHRVGEAQPQPVDSVAALAEDGSSLTPAVATRHTVALGGGWSRYHTFFDVRRDQDVWIVVMPDGSGVSQERMVDVGGLLVEDVTGAVVGNPWREVPNPRYGAAGEPRTIPLGVLAGPGPFFETGATRERLMRACRDTTGEAFRQESWQYGCTRVCPDGYDADCDDRLATTRCYHQITVPIAASRIEQLLTGTPTGFAGGNYNYRLETVAVNLVGSNIRDCSASSDGCYGSNNISFSLLHTGPFAIENARGENYLAVINPGRIEGARALAADRYITNPVSDSDASQLAAVTRRDLIGRPLGGTLVLRIWDEPTLDFDRIEDVQIVVGYRYWQHQR